MLWARATKTKRGDQLAGSAARIAAPQFARIQSAFLWEVFGDLPRAGRLFPGLTAKALAEFLEWLAPALPHGYRRVMHGIRAGTATSLAAMRVPLDVLRAWGWWASPAGTDVHYAAFVTATMRTASAILHLVQVRRLRPGFVEFLGLAEGLPVPRWSHILATTDATVDPPSPARHFPSRLRQSELSDSSSEERATVVPAGYIDVRGIVLGSQPPTVLPRAITAQAGLLPAADSRSLHSSVLTTRPQTRQAFSSGTRRDAPRPHEGTGWLSEHPPRGENAGPSPHLTLASPSGCPRGSPAPFALRARSATLSELTTEPSPLLLRMPAATGRGTDRYPGLPAVPGSALRATSLRSQGGVCRPGGGSAAQAPLWDTRALPPPPEESDARVGS